ncbi:MAG: acyltransferase [Rhodospirillales bacterium]|nr:acyltransferase [Rhodospirillales bacterium]
MRIVSLDFLRFLAAMSVAGPHMVIYFALSENLVMLEIVTSLAVEIFFVLSGFVLCPFLARIFTSNEAIRKNLWIFLVRRWMRTLPLYGLALVFFVILFSGKLNLSTFQYALFLQNFYWPPPAFDYFSVSWSLAVEEWFYILFPIFMALFFAAWGLARKIDNRVTVFFIGTVAFIAVFTILRAVSDVAPENWGNGLRRVVLYRVDSIGFGIILYLVRDHIRKIPVVLIAAIIVVMLVYLFDGYERIHRGVSHPIEFRFLIFAATAIFSCAVLALFLRLNNTFHARLRGFSLWGGRVSYGIYLLHIPVAALIGKFLNVWAGAFVGLSLLAIMAVTTVVYYFFEKPILDARPSFQFDAPGKG